MALEDEILAEGTAASPELVERLRRLEKQANQLRMPIAYESMIYLLRNRIAVAGEDAGASARILTSVRDRDAAANSMSRRNQEEETIGYPQDNELSVLSPQVRLALHLFDELSNDRGARVSNSPCTGCQISTVHVAI